jgi:hypothetical protein
MKNNIRQLINLRSRVLAKDIVAIYAIALADVALVASVIAVIVYFV